MKFLGLYLTEEGLKQMEMDESKMPSEDFWKTQDCYIDLVEAESIDCVNKVFFGNVFNTINMKSGDKFDVAYDADILAALILKAKMFPYVTLNAN